MGQVYVDENSLSSIGNAIRNVTNTTNNFYPNQMGPAIENISMGPKIRDASYLFYKDARLDNYKSFINLLDNNMYKTDYMFYECSLNENEFASLNFNTTNVRDTSYMFYSCYQLIDIPKCDFSNVYLAVNMFGECVKLKSISSIQFPSRLANVDNMFYNCTNLIDISNKYFNLHVANFMFYNCTNLVNVENLTIKGPYYLSSAFARCVNLVDASGITILVADSGLLSMANMFRDCYRLTNIPVFDINLANMNNSYFNTILTANMFYNCTNLVDVLDYFINKNISVSPVGMFYNCTNLLKAPLLNFSNSFWSTNMFYNCTNLVDVPEYDFSKVNSMRQMFAKCNNLSDASIQNIINSCLNVPSTFSSFEKRLSPYDSDSIFYQSNITNDRYQNRWQELKDADWSY